MPSTARQPSRAARAVTPENHEEVDPMEIVKYTLGAQPFPARGDRRGLGAASGVGALVAAGRRAERPRNDGPTTGSFCTIPAPVGTSAWRPPIG